MWWKVLLECFKAFSFNAIFNAQTEVLHIRNAGKQATWVDTERALFYCPWYRNLKLISPWIKWRPYIADDDFKSSFVNENIWI